jgi:chemotaxis family two-component system response regulator Rcp1
MRDDEPVRILLVEDNTADVYLFRKALLGVGLNFELTVIEDGGKAIAFVRGEGGDAGSPVPDLVVLDLSLPKNDGIQVLEAIRATKRFANVPVVIASSSPSPPARLKDKDLQVVRYIMKPPDLEGFLRIGNALRGSLLQSKAGNAERRGTSGMANTTTETNEEPKPLRILVVEDNAGDVYLLEKTLQNRHLRYELIRYIDGEQAIRALQQDDSVIPDLILVDLNLPRRAGFDVLQAIRSKPSMVGVPLGVLTSSDAAKDRHRVALTGRGERYIHKPAMLDEFLDQVGQAIEELLAKK